MENNTETQKTILLKNVLVHMYFLRFNVRN